jgi:hypothetical protein
MATSSWPSRSLERRRFQRFGPISILMALGVASTPLPRAGNAVASISSSFRAEANASARTIIEVPVADVASATNVAVENMITTPGLVMAVVAGMPAEASLCGPTQPAWRNTPAIWLQSASASPTPGATAPTNCWPAYRVSFSAIRARCAPSSIRGALNFSRANCASKAWAFASAARSWAWPAASIADASCAFDLLRNSVWMRLFQIVPSAISPAIPMATAASANAESFRNKRYGGCAHEIPSSTITEITTIAANPSPHRSHDDDAPSKRSSEAFIVPFGRYHSGKGNIRALLIGAGIAILAYALLFLGLYFFQ